MILLHGKQIKKLIVQKDNIFLVEAINNSRTEYQILNRN